MAVADTNTGVQYFDKNGSPATGGEVYFYTTGTTTLKDVYTDLAGSTAAANPVQLLDGGIMPLVFLNGAYRRIVKDKNGVVLFDIDPIGGDPTAFGALGDWNSAVTYSIHDLVTGSDGKYYKSLQNSNLNKDPTTPSASWWSEVDFISIYNASETYAAGDIAGDSNGLLWASQTSQSGNTPSSDDGTNWKRAVDDISWVRKSAAFNVAAWTPYSIDASGGSIDGTLAASYTVGDEIIVHNESISTNTVRLTNTALTIKGSNGTVTTSDNLELAAGDTAHLIAVTSTILEVV